MPLSLRLMRLLLRMLSWLPAWVLVPVWMCCSGGTSSGWPGWKW
jgi:hypothetical protein